MVQLPVDGSVDDTWIEGRVVWLGRRPSDDGQVDIIFEVNDAPDLLQEVSVRNPSILCELRKGDRIRVGRVPAPAVIRVGD